MCMYTLSVSAFYCDWLRVVPTSCWYLHCSSLLTFKLISAYLLSEQLLAFWSVRSLDNASKLKSFVHPIAWLLECHWELFNINGEGLPDSQSNFLFIIQACISTSCFQHRDNTLLLNCLTEHSWLRRQTGHTHLIWVTVSTVMGSTQGWAIMHLNQSNFRAADCQRLFIKKKTFL